MVEVSRFLHKTQQKTLLAIAVAVCFSGKLRSLTVAQTLAEHTMVKCKSALQRLYRFVNRSKIDVQVLWAEISHRLLLTAGRMPVVSIDWTEWRFDLRVLSATLSVGKRALPVFVQSFNRSPPRSQNCRENAFIQLWLSFSPSVPESGSALRPRVPAGQSDQASLGSRASAVPHPADGQRQGGGGDILRAVVGASPAAGEARGPGMVPAAFGWRGDRPRDWRLEEKRG
jgi:hypothetical protein